MGNQVHNDWKRAAGLLSVLVGVITLSVALVGRPSVVSAATAGTGTTGSWLYALGGIIILGLGAITLYKLNR